MPSFQNTARKKEISNQDSYPQAKLFFAYIAEHIAKLHQPMMKWQNIASKGFKPTGIAYEYYYNSPLDFSESELLTMLVMPIE